MRYERICRMELGKAGLALNYLAWSKGKLQSKAVGRSFEDSEPNDSRVHSALRKCAEC